MVTDVAMKINWFRYWNRIRHHSFCSAFCLRDANRYFRKTKLGEHDLSIFESPFLVCPITSDVNTIQPNGIYIYAPVLYIYLKVRSLGHPISVILLKWINGANPKISEHQEKKNPHKNNNRMDNCFIRGHSHSMNFDRNTKQKSFFFSLRRWIGSIVFSQLWITI